MNEAHPEAEGQLDPETRRELLSASVDRELTVEERARLAVLLALSAEARRELDELEHLARAMEELVHRPAPMHLLPAIEQLSRGVRHPPGPVARWAGVALRPFGAAFSARIELEGRVRAYDGALHGKIALVVGLCLGAGPVFAAAAAPIAIAVALLALGHAWVASLRVEERWRARTLVLAMVLGAAPPLALAYIGPGAAAAPLALAAAAVALAVLQAAARTRTGDRAWPALLVHASLACAWARPDLVGVLALIAPCSGLAGGALAMFDRERPRLSGAPDVSPQATVGSLR